MFVYIKLKKKKKSLSKVTYLFFFLTEQIIEKKFVSRHVT